MEGPRESEPRGWTERERESRGGMKEKREGQETEGSRGGRVKGEWAEIGFVK